MSEPTLERLDERTKTLERDVATLDADVTALRAEDRAIWRILYWVSGACFGFGAVAALLVPKLVKLLGLS